MPVRLNALVARAALVSIAGCAVDGPAATAYDAPRGALVWDGIDRWIVLANPPVNDAHQAPVARRVPVGEPREGFRFLGWARSAADTPMRERGAATTDARGVAVVDAQPWQYALALDTGVENRNYPVDVPFRVPRLMEVAIDTTRSEVDGAVMAAIGVNDFIPRGPEDAREFSPTSTLAEVQGWLADGPRFAGLARGRYDGGLDLAAPRGGVAAGLDLAGHEVAAADVTNDRPLITGDVHVTGDKTIVRGLSIGGDLVIDANDVRVSFTRVFGQVRVRGDDTWLVQNTFCHDAEITGARIVALGNRGLAPIPRPDGDCDPP